MDLVREALAMLPAGTVSAGLFSIAAKRDEAGLVTAGAVLKMPLVFFEADALQAYSGGARTASTRVAQMHGIPSVAETAALAGAGHGAVLLVARRASARATCAIAGTRA